MKRTILVLTLAGSCMLAGCEPSAPPAAAGAWVPRGDVNPEAISMLTFNPDGTFSAEVRERGAISSVKGKWQISKEWHERTCNLQIPTELDRHFKPGPHRPRIVRSSRADIVLRYWVPAGRDLPVGAKIVARHDPTGKRETANAAGLLWQVEERAVLFHSAVRTVSPSPPFGYMFPLLECRRSDNEKDASLRLRFRGSDLAQQSP